MPAIRVGADAAAELGSVLSRLGLGGDDTGRGDGGKTGSGADGWRGLVVTDETLVSVGHVDRITDELEADGFDVDVYAGVEREPTIADVDDCLAFVREAMGDDGYDFYVGLGGGSCLDVAKATRAVIANGGDVIEYIAEPTGGGTPLTTAGAPLILLPTTAGTGSEISPVAILGVPEQGIKEGISSPHVRADAAVIDPTLTTTLPPDLTARTAMDALGHAIEGYTTHRYDSLLKPEDPADRPVYAGRTDLTEMFSERAIELLSSNVRRAVTNGDDLAARGAMLKGALYGAIAGLTAGASLAHAMAYPVGNEYHTYHGETIAVLTPASTLGYNVASDPPRFARVAELLGADVSGMSTRAAADEAREEFVGLQRDLGVLPSGLAELAGVTVDDAERLAERTVSSQARLLRCNPRPVTKADVEGVFQDSLYNW